MKALTEEDLRNMNFKDNQYWKSLTKEINLIWRPSENKSVKIQKSHVEGKEWYVEADNYNKERPRHCTAHINNFKELQEIFRFCNLYKEGINVIRK